MIVWKNAVVATKLHTTIPLLDGEVAYVSIGSRDTIRKTSWEIKIELLAQSLGQRQLSKGPSEPAKKINEHTVESKSSFCFDWINANASLVG